MKMTMTRLWFFFFLMIDYGVGGKSQTKKISKAHKRINKTRLKVNVRSAFTLTCSLGECADRL